MVKDKRYGDTAAPEWACCEVEKEIDGQPALLGRSCKRLSGTDPRAAER